MNWPVVVYNLQRAKFYMRQHVIQTRTKIVIAVVKLYLKQLPTWEEKIASFRYLQDCTYLGYVRLDKVDYDSLHGFNLKEPMQGTDTILRLTFFHKKSTTHFVLDFHHRYLRKVGDPPTATKERVSLTKGRAMTMIRRVA